MTNSLAFLAADTLGMQLNQLRSGDLMGIEARVLQFGPWMLEVPFEATSDIINSREISFWVKVNQLLLYVIVRNNDVWMVVINGKKFKECEKSGFTGSTIKERIVELKPSLKAVFKWSDNHWNRYDVKILN